MAVFNAVCILVSVLMFQKEVSSQCCCNKNKATTCQHLPDVLTSKTGAPLDNNKASLTVGPRGPLLLYDTNLVDKLCAFNAEKIPERIVHANGIGAYGIFKVLDATFGQKHCKTAMFQHVGQETRFVIRFSTPFLEFGSCDNVQTFRGAAMKFYTCEGNLDLTGLSAPMFTINDPTVFPAGVKVARRDPKSHFFNATHFWDFLVQIPQALNMNIYLLTSRGMPDGYRHMDFFTEHTFKVVNKWGQPNYVKFHFLTDQGVRGLNSTYAASLCGSDPDYAKRDLFNSIAAGKYPSWTMCYQLMTYKQAETFRWNPFDLTKIWPEDEYPLRKIGRLTVNENPSSQFQVSEQAAYAPSHLLPGIEPSLDRLLLNRMFSYADTQMYRLGANHLQSPVNRARVRVLTNQRDGRMAMCDNQGDLPSYFPNSYGQHVCPDAAILSYNVTGQVERYNPDLGDSYSQPRVYYLGLEDKEKKTIYENICTTLNLVQTRKLQGRVLNMLSKVHESLSQGVKKCMTPASQ